VPPKSSRPPLTRSARFGWGAVALILVGVIALIVYAATNSPTTPGVVRRGTTAPGVVQAVSDVPVSTFNAVGTSSPRAALVPPTVLTGYPALVRKGKPEVLAVDAEFSPFSAAATWPLVVALSRFGQFHLLYNMQSSTTSVFPGIQTFSFAGATYSSRYVNFVGVELYSAAANAEGVFTRLATLTSAQQSLISHVEAADPPAGSGSPGVTTLPFLDIGNRVVATTSGFSPVILSGLSQSTIVGDLGQGGQATQPVGQAVVASANYLTAGICAATGQRPGSVCSTRGVRAADTALGLQ
jgi:hypothetical protein